MTDIISQADRGIAASVSSAQPLLAQTRAPGLLRDMIQLLKIRITVMVAVIAGIGFMIGQQTVLAPLQGQAALLSWSWWVLSGMLIGTTLSCMGAAVWNQVIEIDTDRLMHRTRNRPLPAGRLNPRSALRIAVILAVFGNGLLLVSAGWLPALLSSATVAAYVLIYTPMKRKTSLATLVGAAPGAAPVLIGYAAATGVLDVYAAVLFSIMFVWQLPHFLAIAWMYRDDYSRAGIPVLPVTDPTGGSTFRQAVLGSLILLPLGLMPTMAHMAGPIYFFGALIAGIAMLGFAIALWVGRSTGHARALFFVSLVYLPLVYILLVVDGR